MIPRRVHFVGIGGDGMCALATVLAERGHVVSGSDASDGRSIARLRALGIAVRIGHGELPSTDLVVASPAIPSDNVELVHARQRGITSVRRAELLGRLTRAGPGVGVAGTHGKTTTTGLVAQVLMHAGLDPTVVLGGVVRDIEHARVGAGPFVFEACEGYDALDHTACDVAFVGNVDDDHVEQYAGGFGELAASFARFVRAKRALTVVNGDDARLASWVGPGMVTVGLAAGNGVRAIIDEVGFEGSRFAVGDTRFVLPLPGVHNVRNALGAIALARGLGVADAVVRDALAIAVAPRRRLERIGTWEGVELVDDYAHHPTEVEAGIAAARLLGGRLIVAFQPTLYSRTVRLARRFAEVLGRADEVLLTDIAPREEVRRTPDADSARIAEHLHVPTHLCGTVDRTLDIARRVLRPGDVFLTMGSGSIGSVGRTLGLGGQARINLTASPCAGPSRARIDNGWDSK